MAAWFTGIYEKGDKYCIGHCPEVPGANGQGETMEECRESLEEAIRLILQDRLEGVLPSPHPSAAGKQALPPEQHNAPAGSHTEAGGAIAPAESATGGCRPTHRTGTRG